MQIKELEKNELIIKFKVTIPHKEVEVVLNEKAHEIAKTAKIDGFRAGKIPLSVIKSKYKNPLRSETIDALMKSASQELVAKNKLTLSSTPEIDHLHFHDGEDLSFEIEVELLPVIPALDAKNIKLEKKVVTIEDEEIQKSLDKLLQDFKTFNPLPKDTAAQDGDTVLIDVTGSFDGKEFKEGQVINKQLTLGSGEFIPGFESGLIGAKAGETKTLNLMFPDDYWKKEFSGKPVDFEVTVKELSKSELPAVDDELAKKFNLKNLEELKEKVSESLGKHYEEISTNILRKELFDYLDSSVTIPVPQKLIKKELEFLADNSESEDGVNKNLDIATRRVKVGLILSDLAKEKGITISQEDVRTEIAKHLQTIPAQQHGFVLDYYKNNPQALEHVRGKIIEDKSVELLLQEISISEKKVTTKELTEIFQEIK